MRKRKLRGGVNWQGGKTNGRKSGVWCTDNSQILGATIQNLVSTATWNPGFVHP